MELVRWVGWGVILNLRLQILGSQSCSWEVSFIARACLLYLGYFKPTLPGLSHQSSSSLDYNERAGDVKQRIRKGEEGIARSPTSKFLFWNYILNRRRIGGKNEKVLLSVDPKNSLDSPWWYASTYGILETTLAPNSHLGPIAGEKEAPIA